MTGNRVQETTGIKRIWVRLDMIMEMCELDSRLFECYRNPKGCNASI